MLKTSHKYHNITKAHKHKHADGLYITSMYPNDETYTFKMYMTNLFKLTYKAGKFFTEMV